MTLYVNCTLIKKGNNTRKEKITLSSERHIKNHTIWNPVYNVLGEKMKPQRTAQGQSI